MAVYNSLLLNAGGGVVFSQQLAEQVENTATILIGLGGTGIDCLRTIKTEVYSRLKPDSPEDAVLRYGHIRFLGVDCDISSQGKRNRWDDDGRMGLRLPLDDSEFFSIANPRIGTLLRSEEAIKRRKELSCLFAYCEQLFRAQRNTEVSRKAESRV